MEGSVEGMQKREREKRGSWWWRRGVRIYGDENTMYLERR